jgi:predicted DNA-binding transcriptional regulator AlpA
MDEKVDQHDVAKYLGVSTRTVRNLIKRGELPAPIRIGGSSFGCRANSCGGWNTAESHRPTRSRPRDRRNSALRTGGQGSRCDRVVERVSKTTTLLREAPTMLAMFEL